MILTVTAETDRHRGKRWVAWLLGFSCLFSLTLYFSYTPPNNKTFTTAAQIDSLIQLNFDRFNISGNQIRTRTIHIDTLSSRSVYTVNLPPGFSKTQWHYELDKLVRPYGAGTPAKVLFPERNMRIHITYNTNVVRTVQLRTDPDLVLYRDFATVILAFDRPPTDRVLNRIRSFGEPLQLAIRSQAPRVDFKEIRNLRREYRHTVWWIQDSDGNDYSELPDMESYLNRLGLLDQIDSGSRVLFFNPYEEISDTFSRRMRQKNLMLIDVSEALMIGDLTDQVDADRVKRELKQRSSLTWPPTVIVEGTGTNIRLLQEFITSLKQDHVQLRSPYVKEF